MMRTSTWLALCIAAIGLLPGHHLYADVIASDDFTDFNDDTELVGEDGGTGWLGPWLGDGAVSGITGVSLFYDTGAGFMETESALEITGNNDLTLSRDLESEITDDFYLSFLVSFAAGSIGANDFVAWWLNTQNGPNVGLKTDEGPLGEDLMIRSGDHNTATVWSATQVAIGSTYLVVVRFGKSTLDPGDNYDTYSLWVNPSAEDEENPEVVLNATIDATGVSRIGMRSVNLSVDDQILFGALRMGTAWSDVVPVDSEPGGFRRGDSNRDGGVNIADAVYILQNIFAGGAAIRCEDAADANDDESVNIADAVYLLQNIFASGPAIPPPHPACGPDTTGDTGGVQRLGCDDYCDAACHDPPQACK